MRFQHRICGSDRLETLFSLLVSDIRIGMMTSRQRAISGFDLVQRHGPGQIQCGQRLAEWFWRTTGAGTLSGGFPGPFCTVPTTGTENIQRVENVFFVELCFVGRTGAQFPGRALSGGVGTQMGLDLAGCHAAIKIPAGIVFAHMVKAEPEVGPQGFTSAGRTIAGTFHAARMIAGLLWCLWIGIEGPMSGRFTLHGV